MVEQSVEFAQLLKIARSVRKPLLTRLRALSQLTQALDRLFTEQISSSDYTNHQLGVNLPRWLTITVEDATNIFAQVRQIVQRRIIPRLEQQHIYLASPESLTSEAQHWLHQYFIRRIYPLLTPLAVDPGHPFPYISSDSLNYLTLLQAPQASSLGPDLLFARVKVPRRVVPRIVSIPAATLATSNHHPIQYLVWSEDIVRYFAAQLFPGMIVKGIYQFHILRSAVDALPQNESPKKQKPSSVVRLDIEERIPEWVLRWLLEHLDVPADAVVRCAAPLNIAGLGELADALAPLLVDRTHQQETDFSPYPITELTR